MLVTAIIAFREFLEAFLLVGIFIGIERKLHLGKLKEILLATALGILISLSLPITVFFFARDISYFLTEKNTDTLEGYLLIFSGCFLAYVVFALHNFMKDGKKKIISNAQKKMEKEIFDISLFLTIVFFIAREGFEVALLIATTSLFSSFAINMLGLVLGFLAASIIGCSAIITYLHISIKKIFQYTEYFIVVMGAAMVMNGLTILFARYTNIHLEKYLPLPLQFLPTDSSILGHLLRNLLGLQKNMSLIQLLIMTAYATIIYFLFLKQNTAAETSKKNKQLRV